MADRALTRLCQPAPFSKDKTTFRTLGWADNKMITAFVCRFPDVSEMIINILFRNFQKTREFFC
ncbi:MAG: hypothetical protein AB7Y74_03745 [Syntrophorhabdus sp.]